jgi:hypothetical protein
MCCSGKCRISWRALKSFGNVLCAVTASLSALIFMCSWSVYRRPHLSACPLNHVGTILYALLFVVALFLQVLRWSLAWIGRRLRRVLSSISFQAQIHYHIRVQFILLSSCIL